MPPPQAGDFIVLAITLELEELLGLQQGLDSPAEHLPDFVLLQV
jgi:hypothetical protein